MLEICILGRFTEIIPLSFALLVIHINHRFEIPVLQKIRPKPRLINDKSVTSNIHTNHLMKTSRTACSLAPIYLLSNSGP